MANQTIFTTPVQRRIEPTAQTSCFPGGWVPAGSTGRAMSALGARVSHPSSSSLTVEPLPCSLATSPARAGRLFGEFRRQEHDGTGLTSASFLTEAVQFPQPFDYITDSFETGAAWSGRKASFRVSYTGSWFER
jgi:hypothetical protein